jgi:hypothetical protein
MSPGFSRPHFLVSALVAGSMACSTTTSFVVENAPAGTVLDVGTAPPAAVGTSPVAVDIATGAEPVPWKLRSAAGAVVDEGMLERTEVQWPVVATGLGLAACCVPTGAVAGFCLANPALLAAPISCLAGNAGVVVTTLASPSWASGPLTAVGMAAGATPLLLGLAGQAPPAQVTISLPAPVVPAVPPAPVVPAPAIPTPAGAPDTALPPSSTPTPTDEQRPIGEPNRMPF